MARTFTKCCRGTTAIEFAMLAPALFLLIAGICYAGLLLYSAMGLQHAVQKAARCYSVNSSVCGSALATQTFAQGSYFGVSSPTFTVSTAACGHQVSAALAFKIGWNVPLSATACFP